MSGIELTRLWRRLTVHQRFYVAAALVGFVMIALRITPSSYGTALEALGAPKKGLLAFSPRPIRSDEWAVITPAIQATVNNGFERYNATSFYNEDLRQVYALPVHDWGFAFRPTMWLFGLAPPSIAFSAYHVLTQLMFVVGFALLFRRSGLVGIKAWLLSACLYWSAFVQYFWTAGGPVIAWWPWLTLAILATRQSWWALPVVSYVFACWALSFFYPPLFISLGFVTACVVLAFRQNRMSIWRLAACGVACAVGASIAIYYLRDTLLILNDTLYPGQRRTGGGGQWAEKFVSMFLPFTYIFKSEPFGLRASLPPTNICELGVVGTVYFLFALIVLAPYRAATPIFKKRRAEALILVLGLAAVLAWMFVEMPAGMGTILLWDRVPPARMVMAAGVLMAVTSVYIFRHLSTRLTWMRLAFGLSVILLFVALKASHGEFSFRLIGRDLIPAVGLITVFLFRNRLSPSLEHTSLLGVAALTNCLCFASFNPVQQADPIFSIPDTEVTRRFADHARSQHGRPLLDAFPGRVLNGLGYSSIAHVEAVPQMALWRRLFPEVRESTLQTTFNRYAHIMLTDEREPRSPQADVALVPRRLLHPRVERVSSCERVATPAGRVAIREESIVDGKTRVVFRGTVLASGVFRDQVLRVLSATELLTHVDINVQASAAIDTIRDEHDFVLTLDLPDSQTFEASRTCLLFVDERATTTLAIDDPAVAGECDACLVR